MPHTFAQTHRAVSPYSFAFPCITTCSQCYSKYKYTSCCKRNNFNNSQLRCAWKNDKRMHQWISILFETFCCFCCYFCCWWRWWCCFCYCLCFKMVYIRLYNAYTYTWSNPIAEASLIHGKSTWNIEIIGQRLEQKLKTAM